MLFNLNSVNLISVHLKLKWYYREVAMSYDEGALKRELIRDEGQRLTAYRDSLGNWTIGVGHLLQGDELRELGGPGGRITESECAAFLAADIQEAESRLTHIFPSWRTLDDVRQRALLNLTFNLGMKLRKFVRFLGHMADQNWDEAVVELKDSRWWDQVGARGPRIAKMIRTGRAA